MPALTGPASRMLTATKRSPLGLGTIYSGATALPRLISLALLPVFTYVLSPAAYGQVSVALSAYTVATIVFSLGLDLAVFRNLFMLADDPDTLNRFVGSVWSYLLVVPGAGALALSAVAAPVLWHSEVLPATHFALAMIASAIFVSATTVPLALLRAQERIRDYLLLTIGHSVATTALVVALVVGARASVTGWLAGVVAANVVALAIAVRVVPYSRPRPFDSELVREALRLSLPVLPHFTAMWALQLADRILVAALLSTAAAGIYSVASNIALPMSVLIFGFGQGFMPTYAQAATDPEARADLRSTIGLQVAVVAGLCAACALLSPLAVHLLTDARYADAATLAPWIVLGYGLLGLYAIPMAGLTMTHGQTRGIALISTLGAAVNVGLILALARAGGLEAVAIASALGYGALLIAVSVFAVLKQVSIPYPWRRIGAILAVAVGAYSAGAQMLGDTQLIDLFLRTAWALGTAGLIALVATAKPANVRCWFAR